MNNPVHAMAFISESANVLKIQVVVGGGGGPVGVQGIRLAPSSPSPFLISYENEMIWSQ